jgi:hypothetical protein
MSRARRVQYWPNVPTRRPRRMHRESRHAEVGAPEGCLPIRKSATRNDGIKRERCRGAPEERYRGKVGIPEVSGRERIARRHGIRQPTRGALATITFTTGISSGIAIAENNTAVQTVTGSEDSDISRAQPENYYDGDAGAAASIKWSTLPLPRLATLLKASGAGPDRQHRYRPFRRTIPHGALAGQSTMWHRDNDVENLRRIHVGSIVDGMPEKPFCSNCSPDGGPFGAAGQDLHERIRL